MITAVITMIGVSHPLLFQHDSRSLADLLATIDEETWIKVKNPSYLKMEYTHVIDRNTGDIMDTNGKPVMNAKGELYPDRKEEEALVVPDPAFFLKAKMHFEASAAPHIKTSSIISADLAEGSIAKAYTEVVPPQYTRYTQNTSSIALVGEEEMEKQIIISGTDGNR